MKQNQRFGMKKGVRTRACSGCGDDLGDRYPKQRYCKSCHAANMRRNRPKHKDLNPLARKKANARAYAKVYLKKGYIKKKPCQNCGSEKSQMHHEDYDKPTDVIWLCRPCHLDLHKKKSSTNNSNGKAINQSKADHCIQS